MGLRVKKRIVRTELRSTIRLTPAPQARHAARQAIVHLKQQRILPMVSVRAVTTGYRSALDGSSSPFIACPTATRLHVIYERLRVADEQMDEFEESFIKAVNNKIIQNPWSTDPGTTRRPSPAVFSSTIDKHTSARRLHRKKTGSDVYSP